MMMIFHLIALHVSPSPFTLQNLTFSILPSPSSASFPLFLPQEFLPISIAKDPFS